MSDEQRHQIQQQQQNQPSQQQLQRRHNCCRLCLAPDNECISILNSYAADKEPLASKIHTCVSVKISSNDNLSLSICHACISYLNSWQSFKNRCLAAQVKQRSWLEESSNNSIQSAEHHQTSSDNHHYDDHHKQQQQQDEQSLASSILEGISTLKKRKSLTVYPLPAVQIKDEPLEMEDDYNGSKQQQHDESDEMVVDPTMFLERTADEGDYMETTSNYDYEVIRPPADLKPLPASTTIRMSTKEAACRACNLKFSTRANARRHEKNLHPNLFETLEENDQSINKQTAALNASLELQRAVAAAVAADACKLSSGAVITPQKYRQEVVNAFNNSEFGFDYDNPEKYRELLTDEKIIFLQQNDEFLRQYQNMTCRCCNKYYSTYKNFMAHMRKKYHTLPRNCCFNCLKLNDSKALFISHLKKRNCINLHKVLHNLMAKNANFAAAVTATVAAAPEKMRANELVVNKMYECKLCPKTFRLKLEFRSHVYDEHADFQRKDVSSTQCCYCAVDIEDPADRKRHYNNMDCIVTLRCVTCDIKFETQQKFMEHAQQKHLADSNEQTKFVLSADNSPSKMMGENYFNFFRRKPISIMVTCFLYLRYWYYVCVKFRENRCSRLRILKKWAERPIEILYSL